MNKFVDFGKRGVELPAGCKDLIDVLRRPEGRPAGRFSSQPGTLADVPKYVSRMLRAEPNNLAITWEQKNYIHLFYRQGKPTVLAVIHQDSGREQAVRQVFESAHISPELDETAQGASFVRLLGYAMPSRLAMAKDLICELLRSGYGLAQNTRVEFGGWDNHAS